MNTTHLVAVLCLLLIGTVTALALPRAALAVWWNPLTWFASEEKPLQQPTTPVSTSSPSIATLPSVTPATSSPATTSPPVTEVVKTVTKTVTASDPEQQKEIDRLKALSEERYFKLLGLQLQIDKLKADQAKLTKALDQQTAATAAWKTTAYEMKESADEFLALLKEAMAYLAPSGSAPVSVPTFTPNIPYCTTVYTPLSGGQIISETHCL